MIELPEAVVMARQMDVTLRGKRIEKVTANQSPHKFAWFTGDPADYPNLLIGKTIRGASAFAWMVEVRADDMLLELSTNMRYHAAGSKLPQKHQLLLTFDDQTCFSASVQMWGGLFCYRAGEKGGFADNERARQLPSPLSDAFTREYFSSLFNENTPKLSAKAFLATEQRIPGLGNGVLQDILWTAKIHPKRKMGTLSEDEINHMFNAIRRVLKEMVSQGGRDTERDLFDCPGGYRTVLSKNTVGQPCPTCGGLIQKEAYLGGSIYYCEGCQRL